MAVGLAVTPSSARRPLAAVNSWDRQPYLTRNGVDDGFPADAKLGLANASYIGAPSTISANLVINGYNGVWALDHDDGSQRWTDTGNVLVWGGCKNNLGNSKACDGNLIIYPGLSERSLGDQRCLTDASGTFARQFYRGNVCLSADGSFFNFGGCNASNLASTVYRTSQNTFYSPNATFTPPCGVEGGFAGWQALGQDSGSVVRPTPPLVDVVALARKMLQRQRRGPPEVTSGPRF